MNKTLAAVSAALFAVGALAGPALAAPGHGGGHGGGGGGNVGGGGGGGGHAGGHGGGGGGFAGPRHGPVNIAPPQIAPQRPSYVPNVRPDGINRHHGHHRHGRRIIIGAPYYYGDYYDYGASYRTYDDECGYLWQRWQRTGNPKWKARYYRCID